MRQNQINRHRRPSRILLLSLLITCVPAASAQNGDRAARAAQWDGYQLPAGKFTRFVDKQKGFSFRLPADWKQEPGTDGESVFKPASGTINLTVITDEIPEGSGVANYVSSVMQSFRNEPIKPESAMVRRVMSGGLEWREITHEVEVPGGVTVRQTLWFTAVGPRAYGFALTAQNGEMEANEPIFKRIVSSIRIGAAGHWNEEFETLRANFTAASDPESEGEIEVGRIAEALRSGRESFTTATNRIAELFAVSLDAAIDLITDADPQVRTAAIAALGKSNHQRTAELLIWALSDKDVFASSTAAQALAERGSMAAIKSKLATLSENATAVVRIGAALGESASRELIEELLGSESANQQMAGLQLALIAEKFDSRIPYAKLLASTDIGVLHTLVATLQRHAGADAANELVKFLRTDNELWAARSLGEIAPSETAQELNKRIAEIDAQLSRLGHSSNKIPTPKRGKRIPDEKKSEAPETFALTTTADLKTKPEVVRLALLRGELDRSARKIKFRDRWSQAKTEAERRQIKSEIIKEHFDLTAWSEIALKTPAPVAVNASNPDLAKLKDAPATGETLFPKESFSYVMAPNFAMTMERIDTALSGVQMATVRDQMTFALILKALKAALATRLGSDVTSDASKAIGVDLKSPIALASWPAPQGKETGQESGVIHSAVTVRVTDRARFERLLATYQEEFGNFDQFFTVTPALSRFAGIIPAAVPVIFASVASDETRGKVVARGRSFSESKLPSLKPFSHTRSESLGGLPITTIVKPVVSELGGARRETICIAYLGETAIVSPSREGIADLLAAGTSGETIARSEAFTKSRSEKGEIIFFSRLNTMLKPLFDLAESADKNDQIAAFIKAFSVENGALQLTASSLETVFKIGIADNEFTKSFKPFKVDALAAPRELVPRSTILYAGAVVDASKLYSVLKSMETAKDRKKTGKRDKEIDADIEKLIVPNMQGEIAAALVSLKPVFDGAEWPAMALALKLKNGELAAALRAGKLFANFQRVSNTTVMGSPVVALGEEDDAPFVAVTGDYLILAESVETLRSFEAREKFSSSRDFARSTKDAPGDLAMFATYNLESAFDEASKALTDSSSQQSLPFLSAVIHAFHSQRAYLAVEKDGLVGRLSVSFDREGRYSVGDLANATGDFDLANAIITPTGLTVIQSPQVESMTLRIAARRAGSDGVATRVRDDLAKFNFQRIESSDDSTVVVTTSARRVPEKLTIALPVAGPEFMPFLNPTARINSKDPRVVALAKQIAGEDKDGRVVARKIGEWTYRNLKWKKVESDTVETLASRAADCLEHSELYVALARSLGLPARVVTGAALSGGSFGAHAWVEIYLGKWVELDPTWGLMNHVDATHLRFDGDAFTSYAMLNQIELEITSARRTIANYQRDPIRLVKEFSLAPATRDLAFDLSLTAEQALGRGRWAGLDEKQRAAVITAFEKTVNEMWETWDAETPAPTRVLQSDIKPDSATVTLLRGDVLLRLTLVSRDGAWFITEHEIVDDALPEFADALQGALQPAGRRGLVFETSIESAAKHIEKMIAREGEKPELLLLKSRVLSSQKIEDALKALEQTEINKTDPAKGNKPDTGKTDAGKDQQASDPSVEVLKEIAKRWPDFAPARLALARELFSSDSGEDAVTPLSKDAERAIAELNAYARLAPYDPRPWRDLATAYEQFDKLEDAESALEKAIALDLEHLDHHTALVNFHLLHEHPDKAKTAFARMLKANKDVDEIFGEFSDEEGYDPDYAKSLESLLLAFPKEMEGSVAGWTLLAGVQETLNKIGDAIKSMQRAIAIEPYSSSYEYLSSLYRTQRRFTEALNAANQAIKLDEDSADAHFERACSLAQLGRKREAIAALKNMLELDPEAVFDPDETDLQPLAAMPEFKAMKEKMKEASAPSNESKGETKPEERGKEKADKQKSTKP
ncbi:MAG TPA: transglutaminase domain-containing protein [Blastocatellia bacterium]|nr:transglutaminase domain-containing protein [Blastocatellia bacterium]